MIAFVLVFWSLVLGGVFYCARRFLRILEQRSTSGTELSSLRERVLQLEETVESIRGDVGRLDAGQEFTHRLLAARSPAEPPSHGDRGEQATR